MRPDPDGASASGCCMMNNGQELTATARPPQPITSASATGFVFCLASRTRARACSPRLAALTLSNELPVVVSRRRTVTVRRPAEREIACRAAGSRRSIVIRPPVMATCDTKLIDDGSASWLRWFGAPHASSVNLALRGSQNRKRFISIHVE